MEPHSLSEMHVHHGGAHYKLKSSMEIKTHFKY